MSYCVKVLVCVVDKSKEEHAGDDDDDDDDDDEQKDVDDEEDVLDDESEEYLAKLEQVSILNIESKLKRTSWKSPHHYERSHAIWDHTVVPATHQR